MFKIRYYYSVLEDFFLELKTSINFPNFLINFMSFNFTHLEGEPTVCPVRCDYNHHFLWSIRVKLYPSTSFLRLFIITATRFLF